MAGTPSGVTSDFSGPVSLGFSWTMENPSETPWAALSLYPDFSVMFASAALSPGASGISYLGLASNTTYYFRVKVSTEPDSAYSPAVSAMTLPDMPQTVSIDGVYIDSFTAHWLPGNNPGGTSYVAEAAMDEAFTLNNVFSSGTALSASLEGLNPNTTWYLRVKAVGAAGADGAYNNYGSTITLAAPPGGEYYDVVSSTGISLYWDDAGNPYGTGYELAVSTWAAFEEINYSTVTDGSYYEAEDLRPNTTYYFKAAAINGSGLLSAYSVFSPTVTYAAVPADNPPGLGPPGTASVHAQWLANGNPNYTEYYIQASTAADFTGVDAGPLAWFAVPAYDVTGLEAGMTYYFRVRARDFLGRPGPWFSLGQATMQAGADLTPPSVVNMQGGDDTWRGSSSGMYRVYFSDLGSGLDKFQVKVATGPGFSGIVLDDWTDAVTGINSSTYETDWPLPLAVFGHIPENVKCYVSVRVYDAAGNATVLQDAFYVKRDITRPVIAGPSASPPGWLASDPGAVFSADFSDALSGLAQAQYSASDLAGSANADVLDWTGIPGFVPGASFTAPWGVNFAGLSDGVTNYISVRGMDAAGNVSTLNDAFRILKNTVGPAVLITSPAGAYVSTVTAFAGTASPMNEVSPVVSGQVSLLNLSSNQYYDGAAFSSASEVWLAAQGALAWSYNASTVPFSAGVQYALFARSTDIHGFTTKTPYPSVTFQLDQQPPSVYLSTPLPSSQVYAFDEVSGTAADAGPAGLAVVEVYVKSLYDGKWWNFSTGSWGSTPVAGTASGGASWTFAPDVRLRGGLAHGQQYFVAASAKDAAYPANASVFGAAGSTFTWIDTVPPSTVSAFMPSTGTLPGRVDLAWVFPGDDGGAYPLTYGRFAVQYSTYEAVVFSTPAAQVLISTGLVQAGATQYYTVSNLQPDATYYLRVWTEDDAGLWSGASPEAVTLSGQPLNDMISGTVKTPSGTGVTGVFVEAISGLGVPVSSAYTQDDGNGGFTLQHVPDGIYRVQATWVQDGFSSSIAKDEIPMGYADANFQLSVDYLLASVSGTLSMSSRPSGFSPAAAGGGQVQLWQGARMVASAAVDAAGHFSIRNLIPGAYSLHVRQQDGSWKSFTLQLSPGQALEVKPLGSLLRKGSVYAYPNPAASHVRFHAETDISPARLRLAVYSVDGSLVAASDSGEAGWTCDPGTGVYEYLWDFPSGRPASGVYFYTIILKNGLSGETQTVTRKFAVLR